MKPEGQGIVAPAPVLIAIDKHAILAIKDACSKIAALRGYRHRKDGWGRGMISSSRFKNAPDLRDDIKPLFAGKLGEWATANYLNGRLKGCVACTDLVERPRGDGGIDLFVFGLSIQVKTRISDRNNTLVKVRESSGHPVPLSADVFVFCEFRGGDHVSLLGWAWCRSLADVELEKSFRLDHWNIAIHDHDLLPMCRLTDEIKWRKEEQLWL